MRLTSLVGARSSILIFFLKYWVLLFFFAGIEQRPFSFSCIDIDDNIGREKEELEEELQYQPNEWLHWFVPPCLVRLSKNQKVTSNSLTKKMIHAPPVGREPIKPLLTHACIYDTISSPAQMLGPDLNDQEMCKSAAGRAKKRIIRLSYQTVPPWNAVRSEWNDFGDNLCGCNI